jgi:hypothetical protein
MKKEMCHTDFSTARVDGARGSGKMTFIRNSLHNHSGVLSLWPFVSSHDDSAGEIMIAEFEEEKWETFFTNGIL